MDFRKFLGKEERLVFPYLGGPTVEGYNRLLRLKERPARGWHVFRVVGRNAWPVEAASPPDEIKGQAVRGHHFGGYLFGDDGLIAELELCETEQEAFAPCRAYRWSSGDLIFAGVEFEGEAEGQVREALEEMSPLNQLKGVASTLRQAYGFAVLHRRARQLSTHIAPVEVAAHLASVAEMGVSQANVVLQRVMQERVLAAARVAPRVEVSPVVSLGQPRVAEPVAVPAPAARPDPRASMTEAERQRLDRREREANLRAAQQAAQSRVLAPRAERALPATPGNAAERAEEVLIAAGARPASTRLLDRERLEVTYRFMNNRFITVVHPITLQVLDAGICLAGADRMVTLDSLPSVIREAIQTSRLVITRR